MSQAAASALQTTNTHSQMTNNHYYVLLRRAIARYILIFQHYIEQAR